MHGVTPDEKQSDLQRRAVFARTLAKRAGELVRGMQAGIESRDKGGGLGPVTAADLASEQIILDEIRKHYPDEAIVSEETLAAPARGTGPVWCIDPLDGTREYAEGRDDYTVMIGLLVAREPVVGALAIPATGRVVWGARGSGAWIDDDPAHVAPLTDLDAATLIHSRSHTSPALAEVLQRLRPRATVAAGSAGYKAAQIITGEAQVYIHPRRGTMWWDSVAPAAVVLAAGGYFADALMNPIVYDGPLEHETGLLFAVPELEPALRARLT